MSGRASEGPLGPALQLLAVPPSGIPASDTPPSAEPTASQTRQFEGTVAPHFTDTHLPDTPLSVLHGESAALPEHAEAFGGRTSARASRPLESTSPTSATRMEALATGFGICLA